MHDTIKQLVNMAGGQTQASRLLYTTQPTVSRWLAGIHNPPRATIELAKILLADLGPMEGYEIDTEEERENERL